MMWNRPERLNEIRKIKFKVKDASESFREVTAQSGWALKRGTELGQQRTKR
jgi:hypothetical protein